MPHFEQKPPHPFPLKNKNLPVETRAVSPQPFMFQYVCRSLDNPPAFHARCSLPLLKSVDFCRLVSTFDEKC